MEEHHAHEQYFFDEPTAERLCRGLEGFQRPVLLASPSLGAALHRRGRDVVTLDIDERFAHLPGFRCWDMRDPQRLEERFDLILCDPPFFGLSLSRLGRALAVLAQFDNRQPMAVSYLVRRGEAFEASMDRFGLRATGWRPGYSTVTPCEKNSIEFFANFNFCEVFQ